MLLGAWSKSPTVSGIAEGPQGWKVGTVCLQKGEGQEKAEQTLLPLTP